MGASHTCDWCHWKGDPTCAAHRLDGEAVCPECWADGFDCPVRELMGPLIESLCPPEPGERKRKAFIEWTDEEYEIAARVARAKEAHDRADVYLKTTVEDARQGGFDFMREEFKVAPRRPK